MKQTYTRLIDLFFWLLGWAFKLLILLAIAYTLWMWWEYSLEAQVLRGEY